jgi:hypothetical protein
MRSSLYTLYGTWLICLLAVAGASGCKKKDALPPLTQEGKNILACKFNGQVQIYSGIPNTFNVNGVKFSYSTNHIELRATNADVDNSLYITLHFPPQLVGNNDYILGSEASPHYVEAYCGRSALPYFTKANSGQIRFIRIDKEVAAGTFSFTAYRGNDSLVITDGRFDIGR